MFDKIVDSLQKDISQNVKNILIKTLTQFSYTEESVSTLKSIFEQSTEEYRELAVPLEEQWDIVWDIYTSQQYSQRQREILVAFMEKMDASSDYSTDFKFRKLGFDAKGEEVGELWGKCLHPKKMTYSNVGEVLSGMTHRNKS